jgi:septum formation protein
VARRIDEGIVLAADTIGWINEHPILKPANEADARRILRAMAGREHELWTGVVLWRRPDDVQIVWQERTQVAVAPLSEAELDVYLATRSWRGHSGAYAIQEKDDPYVRVVRGSITNVIGLPLESLREYLRLVGLALHYSPTPPR